MTSPQVGAAANALYLHGRETSKRWGTHRRRPEMAVDCVGGESLL